MNLFLQQMTEEILNEDFDIKSIANAFFKKYPKLLSQVKEMCKNKKSIKPIHIDKKDFNIIKEIYVNKNKKKAAQLIKNLYKPDDNKYSYMMQLITMNEGKIRNFLLSLAFALAMASGLLTSCSTISAGNFTYLPDAKPSTKSVKGIPSPVTKEEAIAPFVEKWGSDYKVEMDNNGLESKGKVFWYDADRVALIYWFGGLRGWEVTEVQSIKK